MSSKTIDNRLVRSEIIRSIREFFAQQRFVETDTPSLVLSPGMEPHIRPIRIREFQAYLPTSPEFAMKRLLAQGYERIFQICKSYRFEPKSTTHNPEFTMLEWYRANSGYEVIMDDVENLFQFIAQCVPNLQGVARPWKRFTIEECFRLFAGLELSQLLEAKPLAQACVDRGWCGTDELSSSALSRPGAWDDLFFRVMLNCVEPAIAKISHPVILYHYPASQAALSNLHLDERGLKWAKRFEVYAGGLELGNAFDELTDAAQQRRRFEKDMALRAALYGEEFPPNPIDEDFLAALPKMPPSGGIAMGVDRLVMYFTGAASIDEVLWLPSYYS